MSWLFGAQDNNIEKRSSDWLRVVKERRLNHTDSDSVDLGMDTALSHSAVYACVDLLADLVSAFPAQRYKDNPSGRQVGEGSQKVEASDKNNVIDEPSDEAIMDVVNWRRLLMVMWMMRGYAPAIVTKVNNRYPSIPAGLELVHPDRVTFGRTRPDAPWRYYLDEKRVDLWPRGRLWIANGKMMVPDEPVGRSILEFAMTEIGLGLYARKFARDFFSSGGHPTGLLTNEKSAKSMDMGEEGARRVKQRFMEALNGRREPVVMTDGWEYSRIQITPDESQFLDTINANRLIICNFFKVPPHLIGASSRDSGGNIVYNNAAERGVDLLKFTVQPWVTRMETVLSPLTVRNEFVKLNVDSLLRADTKRRYDAHSIAVTSGWMTVNEVRALEDLPPVRGGDQILWPPKRANATLEEMAGDPDGGINEPVDPPHLLPSPTDPNKVTVAGEEDDNA